VAFLPDGRLLVDDASGLSIRDLAGGSSRRLAPCDRANRERLLAVSADGRTLLRLVTVMVQGEVSRLERIDPESGVSGAITSHGTRLTTMALDASGALVVTGDEDGLVRLGTAEGNEPHLLYGHTARVTSVAVSPDTRWIASASGDGTIRLWRRPAGLPLHTRPYASLLATLKALTNLRVVPDPGASTGYRFEIGPFPGWKEVPEW
jgi:WD40 repeat protein